MKVESSNGSPSNMPAYKVRSLKDPAVIVAALGYFVDIYDLLLFSIVRKPSLESLGITGAQVLDQGLRLHSVQMLGMLLGGFLWGVLGDKRGRLSVLFGSIFLYSIANILNGFVTTTEQYAVLRFIAGVGLAGEIGAGITLVSEILPTHLRGYGTMIVAGVGVSGAVVAGFVSEFFEWRTNYIIGGCLGLALLALRVAVTESGMFEQMKSDSQVAKGSLLALFRPFSRFKKFSSVILCGIPIWYTIGLIVQPSPEYGIALGISEPLVAGRAIAWHYAGLVIGDFLSGYLSQRFKTRIRVVRGFILALFAFLVAFFVFNRNGSALTYYSSTFILGIFVGYWAVFVTIAAEQFGTNMRSTAATTIPNVVRSTVAPMNELYLPLKASLGILPAAWIVGGFVFILALIASFYLEETYGKDLNYIEAV